MTFLKGGLILLLILIGIVQYLNFTGFCYADMRYLKEREIIDRFLFKERADTLTNEEKRKIIQERKRGEYPYAYWISGEPWTLSKTEKIINKIFGYYYYELNTASNDKLSAYSVNACGTKSIYEYHDQYNDTKYKNLIKEQKLKLKQEEQE